MGTKAVVEETAPLAFVDPDGDVRVNFGVFAGREATQAEIDDLAHTLLDQAKAVTIVSEQRYIVDREREASVHQIRIEPQAGDAELVRERAAQWAAACIAERHADVAET